MIVTTPAPRVAPSKATPALVAYLPEQHVGTWIALSRACFSDTSLREGGELDILDLEVWPSSGDPALFRSLVKAVSGVQLEEPVDVQLKYERNDADAARQLFELATLFGWEVRARNLEMHFEVYVNHDSFVRVFFQSSTPEIDSLVTLINRLANRD